MKNINRHNYEIYFLDALEHRLSAELEIELAQFLRTNPDLAKEFNSLKEDDLAYLNQEEDQIFLTDADFYLGVPASQKEVEHLILKAIEGDASAREKALLQEWSSGSALVQKERMLFEKTKLVPDQNITFEYKNNLLRQEKGRVIAWPTLFRYAAAASVAILFGLLILPSPTPQALSAWNGARHLPKASGQELSTELTLETNNTQQTYSAPTSITKKSSIQSQPMPSLDVANAEDSRYKEEEPLATTINENQVTPIAENSAPMVEENHLPMAPIVQPKDNQKSKKSTNYNSLWDFATAQAKEKLWGDSSYPNENFAVALAQREIKKRNGNAAPKIQYEKKNGSNEESVRLKIGKFELKRKR